eukprot:752768-Hanusia_phi.AAC.7
MHPGPSRACFTGFRVTSPASGRARPGRPGPRLGQQGYAYRIRGDGLPEWNFESTPTPGKTSRRG